MCLSTNNTSIASSPPALALSSGLAFTSGSKDVAISKDTSHSKWPPMIFMPLHDRGPSLSTLLVARFHLRQKFMHGR